jgi:hypothetical protein
MKKVLIIWTYEVKGVDTKDEKYGSQLYGMSDNMVIT